MLHPKENNVLYCVQDVVFVFAKLQGRVLWSGFSCDFAAIHLLGRLALHVIVSIFALAILKPCGKYAIIVALNTIS